MYHYAWLYLSVLMILFSIYPQTNRDVSVRKRLLDPTKEPAYLLSIQKCLIISTEQKANELNRK